MSLAWYGLLAYREFFSASLNAWEANNMYRKTNSHRRHLVLVVWPVYWLSTVLVCRWPAWLQLWQRFCSVCRRGVHVEPCKWIWIVSDTVNRSLRYICVTDISRLFRIISQRFRPFAYDAIPTIGRYFVVWKSSEPMVYISEQSRYIGCTHIHAILEQLVGHHVHRRSPCNGCSTMLCMYNL